MGVKGETLKMEKRLIMRKFVEIQGANGGLSKHNFFTDSEAFWVETAVNIFQRQRPHRFFNDERFS